MNQLPDRSRYQSIAGTEVDLASLLQLRHYAPLVKGFVSRPATGDLAGARVTRLRGRGVDFAEVRAWQAGDDVRSIDWRVTARKGKPHTRIFREERERPALVLIDQGPSLYFGSRRRLKSVAVAEISALLCWAVLDNGDRLGALVRGPADHPRLFRPARSRRRLLRILDSITTENQALPATGGASLSEAVRELRRVLRPGSQVFIVSDFAEITESLLDELTHIARRSEMVLIPVSDPLEAELPPPDTYPIREGSRRSQLDAADPALREDFAARFRNRNASLEAFARRTRSLTVPVITIDNPLEVLLGRPAAAVQEA